MSCFSLKTPFSAVLMLNTRFLSFSAVLVLNTRFLWMRQLIQIVFDVEWQFSLQRNFDYSSFLLHSPVYDPRFTSKE